MPDTFEDDESRSGFASGIFAIEFLSLSLSCRDALPVADSDTGPLVPGNII